MIDKKLRLIVLGSSGMLGYSLLRYFSQLEGYEVYGTVRSEGMRALIELKVPSSRIMSNIDVANLDSLAKMFSEIKPDIVINCVGIVKQLAEADDPLLVVPINTLLPHRLARLAQLANARLIHFSTDCVFSGKQGNYVETDEADAKDNYGRSKFLGEVDYYNAITLRTSIIGHELATKRSLVDWFLSQSGEVNGYTNAIFSGLPTIEVAKVIQDYVIPNSNLHGVYHLSANPINKYDLLNLIAMEYGKEITIRPCGDYVIDRSLNSQRFRSATGFKLPSWNVLIKNMHDFARQS